MTTILPGEIHATPEGNMIVDKITSANGDITVKGYRTVGEAASTHQGETCATEGCGLPATDYFERGGVGSHYCRKCHDSIAVISRRSPAPAAAGVVREALVEKYALAMKKHAAEMAGMPITVVMQHFREFADELTALDTSASEPVGDAHGYATRLLTSLMEKHYPDRSPDWAPLPDLYGVLTQIDNLSTGLVRTSLPSPGQAEPAVGVDGQWRNLALQFDGHRMEAMCILRAAKDGEDVRQAATEFLARPPLSGEQVLASRLIALAEVPAALDKFAYWNSLSETEKAKIRQRFHDDMFGGTDD